MIAPEEFAGFQAILRKHDRSSGALSVPDAIVPKLLTTPMAGHRDAQPANGRFPLVLYFPGLNSTTKTACTLAEFLASHGYVVAAVALVGASYETPDQSNTQGDIEASVRDMESVWAMLRNDPSVDPARLAVVGHSLGGIEAIIFAMRNENVLAAVGLDATYGFEGMTQYLAGFYSYVTRSMRAAILDLRRNEEGIKLDPSAIRAFRFSEKDWIKIPRMRHMDFTTTGMLPQVFQFEVSGPMSGPKGWTREGAWRGSQATCRGRGGCRRRSPQSRRRGRSSTIAARAGSADGARRVRQRGRRRRSIQARAGRRSRLRSQCL